MMARAHAVVLTLVVVASGAWGAAALQTVTAGAPLQLLSEAARSTTQKDEVIPRSSEIVHFEGNITSAEPYTTTEISTLSYKEVPANKAATPRCPSECTCVELGEGTLYTCSLPSGEVSIEEYGNRISFTCTNGTLRFSEVPLRGESSGALAPNSTLRSVYVSGCAFAQEPLLAALRRRGANDAKVLTLKMPQTPLSAVHVQGLGLQSLRITDLDGGEVELPLDVLEALPSLRSLTLDNGRLTLREALPPLPLRALELADDQLQALPPQPFRRLPQLTLLSLWRNRFDHLPNDTLQGLEVLETLSLSSNRLAELPEGFLAPTRLLRKIDLYDNQFTFLPRTLLAGLDQLVEVRLKDNRADLTLDSGAFSYLRSLKNLDLARNRLTSLPSDSFSGCGALQKLILTGNSLHSLPAGLLKDLTSLEELDLSENGLNTIPVDFFVNQHNLTTLRLDKNNLETLPSSVFQGLDQLKELYLSHNKLRSIDNRAFVTMVELRELYLSNNQLSLGEDPSEEGRYEPLFGSYSPFNALKLLTHLDLSHNRVRDILEDWRIVIVTLQELDLSFNNISYIDYVSISFASSEVKVDLRHNNISTVNLNGESQGNAVVFLDNNPFTCDCLTPALQTALTQGGWSEQRPRLIGERLTCAAPSELQGRKLQEVPVEQLTCEVPPPLCPSACHCQLSTTLLDLDCAFLPRRFPSLTDLHVNMTHLRLQNINASLRALPRHVTALNLSGLNFTQVPELPSNIEVDLTNNHLERVPIKVFLKNNNTVRLARNPIACNCTYEEDVTALLTIGPNIVLDYNNVTCSDSTPVRSKLGVNLCAELESTIYGSISVVVLFVLVIAVLLARRYRFKFLICIDRLCCCSPEEDEQENRDKDVFLSYAHPDIECALKLLSRLEEPPHSLKVCHHERDWVVGEYIPRQIAHSVKRSRWTVILLSRHFLTSVWGLLEFREAYLHMQKERKGRILIVLIDDVMSDERMTEELRSYVANNTYLHINDPSFWDRLPYALRRRRVPWWHRTPSLASAASPAPADKQIRSAIEAKVAVDGALANPAFIGPSVIEIFTNQKKQHIDTRNAQVA